MHSGTHAENLFVAGHYDNALAVLGDSLGRNKHFAKQLPEGIAGLYRAYSRVAVHLGLESQYRSSSYQIVRALKAGLPNDDPKVIASRFEVAAMQLNLGKARLARGTYGEIADQAEKIGRGDLSRVAKLRVAWIDALLGDESGAREKLRKMAADTAPEARVSRISALVLLSRLDREKGKDGNTDLLISELKKAKLDKPVLLYAPPIMQELGTDAVVEADPSRQILHVGINRLAEIGHFVDEADLRREKGIRRIFGELRSSATGEEHRGTVQEQRPIDFSKAFACLLIFGAYQNTVRVLEIRNRRAFPQELWVGCNRYALRCAVFPEQLGDLVAGPDRNSGLGDDDHGWVNHCRAVPSAVRSGGRALGPFRHLRLAPERKAGPAERWRCDGTARCLRRPPETLRRVTGAHQTAFRPVFSIISRSLRNQSASPRFPHRTRRWETSDLWATLRCQPGCVR